MTRNGAELSVGELLKLVQGGTLSPGDAARRIARALPARNGNGSGNGFGSHTAPLAIGLEDRHVAGVEGGAGHESEDAHEP